MNITLRKIKVIESMSEETTCYQAEICLDGKLVATAENRGTGGPDSYHFTVPDVRKQMEAYCATLPPLDMSEYKMDPLPMNLERYIGELLEKHQAAAHEKKVEAQKKRWCQKKTVFRLKGDAVGAYRTINTPFDQKIKEHLVSKHGDKLEGILNETV